MIEKKEYKIKFIDDYLQNELYQFEVESKGCLFGVVVETKTTNYQLDFYDTTRFKQDIDSELEASSYMYDYNIIFLRKVTYKNIVDAVENLWLNKAFKNMITSSSLDK